MIYSWVYFFLHFSYVGMRFFRQCMMHACTETRNFEKECSVSRKKKECRSKIIQGRKRKTHFHTSNVLPPTSFVLTCYSSTSLLLHSYTYMQFTYNIHFPTVLLLFPLIQFHRFPSGLATICSRKLLTNLNDCIGYIMATTHSTFGSTIVQISNYCTIFQLKYKNYHILGQRLFLKQLIRLNIQNQVLN